MQYEKVSSKKNQDKDDDVKSQLSRSGKKGPKESPLNNEKLPYLGRKNSLIEKTKLKSTDTMISNY